MGKTYVPYSLSEYLGESKSITLKRKYGERPTITAGTQAPLRNQVLSFVAESGSVSKLDLKKYIVGLKEGGSTPAAANMFIKRNARYFITESRNGVTYFKLSNLGKRLVSKYDQNTPISESKNPINKRFKKLNEDAFPINGEETPAVEFEDDRFDDIPFDSEIDEPVEGEEIEAVDGEEIDSEISDEEMEDDENNENFDYYEDDEKIVLTYYKTGEEEDDEPEEIETDETDELEEEDLEEGEVPEFEEDEDEDSDFDGEGASRPHDEPREYDFKDKGRPGLHDMDESMEAQFVSHKLAGKKASKLGGKLGKEWHNLLDDNQDKDENELKEANNLGGKIKKNLHNLLGDKENSDPKFEDLENEITESVEVIRKGREITQELTDEETEGAKELPCEDKFYKRYQLRDGRKVLVAPDGSVYEDLGNEITESIGVIHTGRELTNELTDEETEGAKELPCEDKFYKRYQLRDGRKVLVAPDGSVYEDLGKGTPLIPRAMESAKPKSKLEQIIENIKAARKAAKMNEADEADELSDKDLDAAPETPEETPEDSELDFDNEVDEPQEEVEKVEITEFIITVDDVDSAIDELQERGVTAERVPVEPKEEEVPMPVDDEPEMEEPEAEPTEEPAQPEVKESMNEADDELDLGTNDELNLGDQGEEADELNLDGGEETVEPTTEFEENKLKVKAEDWPTLKTWLEEKGVDVAEMFGGEIEMEEVPEGEPEEEVNAPVSDDDVDFTGVADDDETKVNEPEKKTNESVNESFFNKLSKPEVLKQINETSAEIVIENERFILAYIPDVETSIALGSKNWAISGPKAKENFNNMYQLTKFKKCYFIFDFDKNFPFSKLAIIVDASGDINKIWNANDQPVHINYLQENYPELDQ